MQRKVINMVINAGIWEEHCCVIRGEGSDYLMEVCPMCFFKAENETKSHRLPRATKSNSTANQSSPLDFPQ